MNIYNNKALSIQEQIERLKKNGLIIDDENQTNKTLSIISYFRLASYWRPMEEQDQAHRFKPNRRQACLGYLQRAKPLLTDNKTLFCHCL